ncbi:MAG: AAA family ATPase [Acidobacteriia bacterium]|nr:AAA family ATPase [Terriglobia bacterium]
MMNTYITNEQRDAWDKVPWSGLINVDGPAAFEYFCNKLNIRLCDGGDPRSWVVFGRKDDQITFIKKMQELGGVTSPDGEPELVCVPERIGNDGEAYPSSAESEDDVKHVEDFIRNAEVRGYWQVGGVVILGAQPEELKYVDRLMKVPYLMHGTTRHIEVPVAVVNETDGWSDFSKPSNSTSPSLKRTLNLVRGDEVKIESVDWLVPEFIPANQPTVFTGEMDTRKSTLALHIAAAGSAWLPWFMNKGVEQREVNLADGSKCMMDVSRPPLITLVAAAEDTYNTTVVPRFKAAGGDLSNIYCVPLNVKHEKQNADGLQVWETPLSFSDHLELLAEAIHDINKVREWKVGLLINDPIISFFGNKNYNNPQDARDIMTGLKKLCEELQITIINICHFNKTLGLTSKQKTAGSKALVEAHRMGWAFDLEDDRITLIAPVKHNLLKEARSYKITTDDKDGVGVIRFVGYSTKSADERIEEKESKDRGSRKEIKKAILDVLKDGPLPAGQVCNTLQDLGVSRTIRRAAESLEEEGKLRRSGTNHKNLVWQVISEAEQVSIFQGAAQQ